MADAFILTGLPLHGLSGRFAILSIHVGETPLTHQIATIARYTLLEAVRTRLPHLLIAVVALCGALGLFVGAIAITESSRMQAGAYASSMRLAAVFIAAFHVLASVSREFNDKGLDVALALDLPRGHYILGKLAGFLVVGACLAVAAGLPLAIVVQAESALKWTISLAFEIGIVAAAALFCAITFRQLIAAASFVVGFYILARTLNAIRLMSAHPLTGADTPSHQVTQFVIEALALVMPPLDAWTQTAWLAIQAPAWSTIGTLLFQSLLYIALLCAAAMFDFYRKNF
jgi:ABC-type transport system involved in multi-copper enzyme maturation permease subunit